MSVQLALQLLVAHAISDYYLQLPRWVSDKARLGANSAGMRWHILVTGLAALALSWHWQASFVVMVLHAAIDAGKQAIGRKSLYILAADQLLHAATIGLAAWLFNPVAAWGASDTFLLRVFIVLAITYPLEIFLGQWLHRWYQRYQLSFTDIYYFGQKRQPWHLLQRLAFLWIFALGWWPAASVAAFGLGVFIYLRFPAHRDFDLRALAFNFIAALAGSWLLHVL